MVWHFVAISDIYNFSTTSKNLYNVACELLPEHYRLKCEFSKINNKKPFDGIFAQVLKEILTNSRAVFYPSSLELMDGMWDGRNLALAKHTRPCTRGRLRAI